MFFVPLLALLNTLQKGKSAENWSNRTLVEETTADPQTGSTGTREPVDMVHSGQQKVKASVLLGLEGGLPAWEHLLKLLPLTSCLPTHGCMLCLGGEHLVLWETNISSGRPTSWSSLMTDDL